ncbi:MAG: Asp-tRNA(Asn)/Glu-tRNA(Gln) amidotransferase subunit GatB [Nanoarchaeota archaeon]|nr:Asp-tRNA(Asn)/Glu-tRNA(Gln) amidotransferase subunit GatB [Nanoarchaeota archaeon]
MSDIKIGLEIHVHLKTKEKLFCRCAVPTSQTQMNRTICPICTGQPGSKPMLVNKAALQAVTQIALLFNSEISKKMYFQRKHYTWPDMPTGYQRTISGPNVQCNGMGGEFLGIGIEEIHLEEDPAAWDPQTGEINYNRSGMALCEVVTKPEFTSLKKLEEWLKEFILALKYLKILHEFGIKSDVNVSIKESGYSRVEIKNVSSPTNIVKAAQVEIERQRETVKKGDKIKQETRRYNDELETTEFMRSKENAQDYRFTPEPDLPIIEIDNEFIEELKKNLPELAYQKREKYAKYKFDEETIEVLVSNVYLTEIFEFALEKELNPKEVGLFLKREILRILNYHTHDFEELEKRNIKEELITLITLLAKETISYTTAQKILEILYDKKINVEEYIEKNNLKQVQDTSIIVELVQKALKSAPKAVEDYKEGNTKSLNFIVGLVMRETKGTANPQIVNKILLEEVQKL